MTYWFARKAWMPELTRFAWLAWIVVGFAFTYGNYLTSLDEDLSLAKRCGVRSARKRASSATPQSVRRSVTSRPSYRTD